MQTRMETGGGGAPENKLLAGKKTGFTLAEVLITLGILGVVMAMTLPSIIGRYNEKARVTQLKKSYTLLSQTFNRIVSETEASPKEWGLGGMYDANTHITLANKFVPYFKVLQNCVGKDKNYTRKHCTENDYYSEPNYYASVRLVDGTTLIFRNWNNDCSYNFGNSKFLQNICGTIIVDVNGQKNPNLLGNDIFTFYLTNWGIFPTGTEFENVLTFETYCNKNTAWGIFIGNYMNGSGCTAWALYKENQEYLHCAGLSWKGKDKCK